MGWKSGDLGRFLTEDPNRPRFEVIRGIRGQGVEVWYGGSARTTIIPADTFREDCVDWWRHDIVVQKPEWVEPGAVFGIGRRSDPASVAVVQAEIKRLWGDRSTGPDKLFLEMTGQTLQVRSIRRDFVSCLLRPKGVLAMVPLKEIVERGYRSKTIWDRLGADEDPYEDETELIRLLDNA